MSEYRTRLRERLEALAGAALALEGAALAFSDTLAGDLPLSAVVGRIEACVASAGPPEAEFHIPQHETDSRATDQAGSEAEEREAVRQVTEYSAANTGRIVERIKTAGQERLAAVAPSPKASGDMQGSPPAPVAPAPIPLGSGAEEHVLKLFAAYWRANYHDGCILSNTEWHLPKLQGAIRNAMRTLPTPVASRAMVERVAEAQQERLAAVAPSPETSGDTQGSPPAPAPSSPPDARRWQIQFHSDGSPMCVLGPDAPPYSVSGSYIVPVVPAFALDAMRCERDEARRMFEHAEHERARLAAKDEADPVGGKEAAWDAVFNALTRARPKFWEVGNSGIDSAVRAIREMAKERDAAVQALREQRRLTPEVLESARAATRDARQSLKSDRDVARAALLAAGFQEVGNG